MKRFFVFSFLFLANCASQTNALVSENSANLNLYKTISFTPTPTPSEQKDSSKQGADSDLCEGSQPTEFPKTNSPIGKVDFNNFSYPKIWEKGSVKLKNGCFGKEYTSPGLYVEKYYLQKVDFFDFNNDGNDEALVEVYHWSAGGSSGYSENFYIYALQGKKLNLLWKIATGTRAYCGMKEYEFKDKQINLELFGKCALKSDGNFKDSGKHRYDYAAEEYTKFVFGWNGKTFRLKSNEILPFPENDIKESLNRFTTKHFEK